MHPQSRRQAFDDFLAEKAQAEVKNKKKEKEDKIATFEELLANWKGFYYQGSTQWTTRSKAD